MTNDDFQVLFKAVVMATVGLTSLVGGVLTVTGKVLPSDGQDSKFCIFGLSYINLLFSKIFFQAKKIILHAIVVLNRLNTN